MWETTFPRNSHAGLGNDFTKMRAYSLVCYVRKLAYPIRRGYFSEMLFPTWTAAPPSPAGRASTHRGTGHGSPAAFVRSMPPVGCESPPFYHGVFFFNNEFGRPNDMVAVWNLDVRELSRFHGVCVHHMIHELQTTTGPLHASPSTA
jgi:hypothetical protein